MPDALFAGLDMGTSGARVLIIDAEGIVRGTGRAAMSRFGTNVRDPRLWWDAAMTALHEALAECDPARVRALAVDGTSGTVLGADPGGVPLGDGVMYNDICSDAAILERIAEAAPSDSPARGATSALARACQLLTRDPAQILHQADWISGRFSGAWRSDENNALKTGYDLRTGTWPDWIDRVGMSRALLPEVREPGTPIGPILPDLAAQFGLPRDLTLVAGTTDGCASFVATGAEEVGDAVTALGTTLTLKLLSDRPIFAPEYGIYSHRILGQWLVGGASNSGGNVLLHYFAPTEIDALSAQIDPQTEGDLGYYPLVTKGERFPIADPDMAPRVTPRPEDDAAFLHGLLTGMARIETEGYAKLHALGAPKLRSLRSVGRGARNAVWTGIRARMMGVPLAPAASVEAAYGTALLARRGVA